MNKKIIIIGSSVSMPRNEVSYEDTWVSKFISTFNNFNVIDRCKRASLSKRLIDEGGDTRDRSNPKGSDLLEFYKPNFSIIELGIVDASPRYFKKNSLFERFLILVDKYVKINFWHYVKKYRKRKPENTLISPEDYKNNFESYITRAKKIGCLVVAFEILPPNRLFKSKNKHISKNIDHYNAILNDLEKQHDNFQLLRTTSSFVGFNTSDFVDELHPNNKGHEKLFQIINSFFLKINE